MGRGCNTIQSPPVVKVHHVDPTVTRGKQQGTPREIRPVPRKGKASRKAKLNSGWKSAEGIVVEGNEPGGGNAPFKRRDRKDSPRRRPERWAGPNGPAKCRDK